MDSPSDGFSARWPKRGTWDRGGAYALPTSERPTDESGCSFLLPTPAAQEPGGTPEAHLWRKNRLDGANRTKPTHLSLAVKMLPTPRAADGSSGPDYARETRDGSGGDDLVTTMRFGDHLIGNPSDELLLAGVAKASLNGDLTNPPSADGSESSAETILTLFSQLED